MIKQPSTDGIEARHRPQHPEKRDNVKCLPVILAGSLEHRRICPEQEGRFAIHRVDVRPTAIDNFVCHDGVRRFVVDGLGMLK